MGDSLPTWTAGNHRVHAMAVGSFRRFDASLTGPITLAENTNPLASLLVMKHTRPRLQLEPLEPRRMLAFGLVADTNQIGKNSHPSQLVQAGEQYFFTATDTTDDRELWTFAPNTNRSTLVKDIRPGAGCSCPDNLVAIGSSIVFRATVDTAAFDTVEQLWVSDGTEDGTKALLDIDTARGGFSMTAIGDAVYFRNPMANNSLWTSRGTPESTVQLSDQEPFMLPFQLGTDIVFSTRSAEGVDWWMTDGTVEGTQSLAFSAPIPQRDQMVVGGQFFFAAHTESEGTELWVTNGTPEGTRLVLDIFEGTGSSSPHRFHWAADGSLFFVATTQISGAELWRSDGTESGTHLVKDIFEGTDGSDPDLFWNFGDFTYFTANAIDTGVELWKTDGTSGNTNIVADLNPGVASSHSQPVGQLGDALIFFATTPAGGRQVWETVGATDATNKLTSVSGRRGRGLERSRAIGQTDDFILVSVIADPEFGEELLVIDGTEGVQVFDINPGSESSTPSDFQTIGNQVYFTASNATSGIERFVSDGSREGTKIVEDLNVATESSEPRLLGQLGSGAFAYVADDGVHGRQLWAAPPTGPAQMLRVLGMPSIINLHSFVTFRGRMFLALGQQIWTTDGTLAGTQPFLDLAVRSEFFVVGERVYFSAQVDNRQQLWKTDGTPDGTTFVKTLGPEPLDLIEFRGSILFLAATANQGQELWITDGTPQGSRLLRDVLEGPGSSNIRNFVVYQNDVYFLAEDNDRRTWLWVTDGTPEGTKQLIHDVEFVELIATDRFLYLTKRGPDWGLWRSDGTEGGTLELVDAPANLNGWAELNGTLYVNVLNSDVGRYELWTTTGSPGQTRKAQELIESIGGYQGPEISQWNHQILFRNAAEGLIFVSDGTGTLEGTRQVSFDGFTGATSSAVKISGRGVFLPLHTNETGSEVFLLTPDVKFSPQVRDLTYNDDDMQAENLRSVSVTFSSDVSGSLSADDLVLTTESSDGLPVDLSSAVFSWDGETNTAKWDFPNLNLGYDTYTIFLGRNGVYDEYGNSLDGNRDGINGDSYRHVITTALIGDINLDGQVDFADFLALSSNFGQSYVSWRHGDLNGDSTVSFADFLLLSANFRRQGESIFVGQ